MSQYFLRMIIGEDPDSTSAPYELGEPYRLKDIEHDTIEKAAINISDKFYLSEAEYDAQVEIRDDAVILRETYCRYAYYKLIKQDE